MKSKCVGRVTDKLNISSNNNICVDGGYVIEQLKSI
jgi:hypothetical protein